MVLRYRASDAPDPRRDAACEVILWVSAILGADEDVVVSVTGHQCGDPDCGGAQTVILLMRPDQPTEAFKIRKPLQRVTQTDVAEALQPILAAARTLPAD